MPDIVIRWSILSALIDWERLVSATARSFKGVRVETLAEAIIEIKLKAVGKPALQPRVHPVVVSGDIASTEEHRRERKVCLDARLRKMKRLDASKFSAGASLITQRSDQLPE